MTKQANSKLVLISDVAARLVLPGSAAPISRNSLFQRLKKLDITPVRQRPEGGSYHVNYVTEAEAALIEADFKNTHWKKFKAAAEKK